MKYVWQTDHWPHLRWESAKIMNSLALARKAQGHILGQARYLQLKEHAEILIEETMATSAIEGEFLNSQGVRSSVARRLGLPTGGLPEPKRHEDGIVAILIDATSKFSIKLDKSRLCGWQAALFPTGYSGFTKIDVGDWRKSLEPMQVVSGTQRREKVHFEAPPSKHVSREMKTFFTWWAKSRDSLDGILRAAMAHFYFVTIHPFEDGNGRIARALTDMALAQDEKTGLRLYSLSKQIASEKKQYYEILERTQKGTGDITEWMIWFMEMFTRALEGSEQLIRKALELKDFYAENETKDLNDRQKKALRILLESYPSDLDGGLTNKKYVKLTGVSPETAKRDLKALVEKNILVPSEGAGRSTSYRLKISQTLIK